MSCRRAWVDICFNYCGREIAYVPVLVAANRYPAQPVHDHGLLPQACPGDRINSGI
jgi:hypothetical protein